MVALVPNLMDRARVEAALRSAAAVEFAADADELCRCAARADLVVVDLAAPGAVAAIADLAPTTVGFGSHVDRALLQQARDAGCDEVVSRSALALRLAQVLGRPPSADQPSDSAP